MDKQNYRIQLFEECQSGVKGEEWTYSLLLTKTGNHYQLYCEQDYHTIIDDSMGALVDLKETGGSIYHYGMEYLAQWESNKVNTIDEIFEELNQFAEWYNNEVCGELVKSDFKEIKEKIRECFLEE